MDHVPPEFEQPQVAPPFRVGERVAFFPVEIGPSSIWLAMDFAIIEDIDEEKGTFSFHFEGQPGVRHAQGIENVVRPSTSYFAWRAAVEEAIERTGSVEAADRETESLRRRVVAERPAVPA